MTLAGKIKATFFLILVFPVIMIGLTGVALIKYQNEKIEDNYDVTLSNFNDAFDKVYLNDIILESVREKIIKEIDEGNIDANSKNYWKELAKKYCDDNADIIVMYKNSFIYNSMMEDTDIEEMLPIYNNINEISVTTYYTGNSNEYLIKPLWFSGKDGSYGTIYTIRNTDEMIPETKGFVIQCIVMGIFLLLSTGTILTIMLYKSIMNPIRCLKNAADNITIGNLDFVINSDTDRKDEFGALFDSFEEMRLHLKATIEENMQYDKENKELISNISHDLKTPITAIKGYVEGIMDGVAETPEKMEKYIKTIYNKAIDMDRLIGELSLYSKIDTNRIPYHFIKLNVYDYFEDCIDEIQMELESKSFKLFYFNYASRETCIMADPEQLKRVINNIISNSLKYNDKKEGIINIRIKDQKDFVHFEIEDNGKGVDKEELPYIFERFYRTDTSRNTKKGGSGIGLSIVKKIIEAHGGSIWAFSTVETGLSIHFLLKKPEEQVMTLKEESSTEDFANKSKVKIFNKVKKRYDGGKKNE